MDSESWHEERERLMKLLAGIEAGTITHVDADNRRELQLANPINLNALTTRLAKLNDRLGVNQGDSAPRARIRSCSPTARGKGNVT
jgi:hypothetical protein